MLGTYFYHQGVRKLVAIFGTLFNNISIQRRDTDSNVQKTIKVPLAYGPRQHYLARINTGIKKELQILLPRMSYEFTSIAYDENRKLQSTTKIKQVASKSSVANVVIADGGLGYTDATPPIVVFTGGGGTGAAAVATVSGGVITAVTLTDGGKDYTSVPAITFDNAAAGAISNIATANASLIPTADIIQWAYNPVPYNFDFQLTIMVKNSDDGMQILEQILPFFTPGVNIPLKEFPELGGIVRDIPVQLESVIPEDTFEGDLVSRRVLTYTLNFVVKGHLYGVVNQNKLIKDITVRSSLDPGNQIIAETYNVVPDPTTAGPDDPFGFTQTLTFHL